MRKDSQVTKTDEVFYVYVLLDPRKSGTFTYEEYHFKNEPFYVGLGHNKRIKQHVRRVQSNLLAEKSDYFLKGNRHKKNKIKRILEEKLKPIEVYIKKRLTWSEANELEIHLIETIGRNDLDLGPLTNLTVGGEGNLNPNEDVRKKIGNAHKGRKPTAEVLKKISDRRKGKSTGDDHWMRNPKYKKSKKVVLEKAKKSQFKKGQEPHNKNKSYEEIYGKEKAKEVKRKIGNRSYKKQTGAGNPSAKKRLIVDPDGNEYIVHGNFAKFIKEHKLNKRKIKLVLKGELNDWNGWKAYELD